MAEEAAVKEEPAAPSWFAPPPAGGKETPAVKEEPALPALSPTDRHPLGVGDVIDRLIACEYHIRELDDRIGVFEPDEPVGSIDPPTNVDTPQVQGSGLVGEELTCTMGNWNNMGSSDWGASGGYRYLWKKMESGHPVALPDATTSTYTPVQLDNNKDVFCTVLATNTAGEASSDSNTITVHAAETGAKAKK